MAPTSCAPDSNHSRTRARRRPWRRAPMPDVPEEPPILRGRAVVLRPVTVDDRERLAAILAEPSVARWWGPPRADVTAVDDWLDADADTLQWVIEVDGAVAGSLQASEEADPDY